ncbi:site-2 protease family protein [Conexibacter sp. JD483]|uniref:site-2 protease family protein n=1 Tax=unclassified Conexibacter TaxID=2627773 RepID=UPI002727492F|nr:MULTISPECIES: site-2 protease family protein [unclassified Conexibacter]MDO8185889.1 site-2 protease family protein [Conexibacter sp. CPCC 205706]MDO8199380.1 site-2 protease family protein [Conexibacter sp. CPCC 205762]MDR9371280.1 site-2 protease family protein [Conexibacter sp. JD483]
MFGRSGSIQLARIFGIRVGVDFTWFVVLFVVIFWLSDEFQRSLGGSDTQAYVTAVIAALLLFASVIVHELGHALAARRHGIEVAGITLSPLGGFALMSRESRTPKEELQVAGAGPLATFGVLLLCALVCLVAYGPSEFADAALLRNDLPTTPLSLTLGWLATMNFIVLLFNLIPAYPLDGGRLTRGLVWQLTGDKERGSRVAARLGQVLGIVLMGLGLWALVAFDPFIGIWALLVGFVISGSARALLAQTVFTAQLEDVRVADIMDEQPVSVPQELTADRALDEFFLRYRWPWFPVVDAAGRFVGVLREDGAREAVESGRPVLPVAELMDPDEHERWRIDEDRTLRELLEADGMRSLGAVMAVDRAGVLRGVVTIGRLRRAVQAAIAKP